MKKKKLIACQIFADELTDVLPEQYKNIDICWLDPGLHANLDKLSIALQQALNDADEQGAEIKVLFGKACNPDMCKMITKHGAKILETENCVQAFCYQDIKELEQNRTMVITPGWVRFFPNILNEMGWDEVDVRQNFGRYDRILVLDTGINPLSEEEILWYFDLTQVPIEIQNISIDHFEKKVKEVLL